VPDLNQIRVSADFNELDEDGRLHVLARQADRPDALHIGSAVLLTDEEDSTMEGRVLDLSGDLVVIQTIAETWRNPLAPPPEDSAPGRRNIFVSEARIRGLRWQVLWQVKSAAVIVVYVGDPERDHPLADYYDLSLASTPVEAGTQ
jgi:hypothetical protein